MSNSQGLDRPNVYLIGAGVVGRAILKAHTDAGVSVWIADQMEESIAEAVAQLDLDTNRWRVSQLVRLGDRLPAIGLNAKTNIDSHSPPLVIESIAERLDVKQPFFADAESLFGDDAVLCSNTSTLRIGTIADALSRPERFCGMHFFMPVYNRAAVEVIGGPLTSDATIDACIDHVHRIGKESLVVNDGPGFVVNRLLSPYLNEAMLLLGRGVSAEQIQRAALRYGMPMSPLELIDWIGTRTMFDAGRVYWQSFPTRMDPAAMLSAFIKSKRFGRACGAGLYDYEAGVRSVDLAPAAIEFSERYRRDVMTLDDDDVLHLLALPMWIEAAIAYRDGIVTSAQQFNLAMGGGLGFQSDLGWLGFFDSLGSASILAAIDKWSPVTACMKAPQRLIELLQTSSPTTALEQFAH